jgi:hypothetical protein
MNTKQRMIATCLLASLLISGCGLGQLLEPTPDPTKGRIEGRVYRSDTDESIANASVTLNDATKEAEDPERSVAETTTDQQGRYSLVNIEPGDYTLSVSFIFQNASDSPCEPTTKRDLQGNVVQVGFPIYTRDDMLFGASAVDRDDGSLELNVFTMLVSEVAAGDLVQVDIDLKCQ